MVEDEAVVSQLVGMVRQSIDLQNQNAIKLAEIGGQLAERDKNCERQNDRLEAVFDKLDSHDERLGKVEQKQASHDGEKANQGDIVSWLAIIIAGIAAIGTWLRH